MSKRRQRMEAEVPQDESEHEESVPTPSNDPQPSGEDNMQLNDLMILCTKLQAQVLDLEKAKDAQVKEIAALKKRVQSVKHDGERVVYGSIIPVLDSEELTMNTIVVKAIAFLKVSRDMKTSSLLEVQFDWSYCEKNYAVTNAKFFQLGGLKRLHGFLELTTAQVHNGNYAKCLNSKVMVLRIVSKSLMKFVIKKSNNSKENSDESLVEEHVPQDKSSFVESSLNVDKETIFPVNKKGKPQHDDKGFVDSGCSRHMTGNIAYLSDFKQFDGGYVAFGGGAYGGKITGKGTLKTDNLDFEDVYFVNELKFNLFSVSQMCDKKNYVLFTDTECLVLSPNFKLPDENQILLKIPRKDNMYSFDMKNIVPKESLTCLVAKATLDESMLWHRRLGHINFKNINKLVKDNLVRGLPTKHFENDQTCVACLKGKQHRAFCKSKVLNPITKPLFMLHIDLFGPTFVSILMHKKYCLVVTDDYSREKGIKREYSVARTPQQNGVAEKRNRTLIETTRTMLADSKLPTTFWAEAVSTTCYVQNRALVVKPLNKTPYELFRGFKTALSFMRPFGCHVTILNTLDSLGKFDGKSDEGFFIGYSLSSKAFRVYNTRTRRVEKNLHIGFLENKPMIEGNGPKWLFDIDSLTQSMNYVPVTAGTISNDSAGTSKEISQYCIVMPIWKDTSYFDSPTKDVDNGEPKTVDDAQKQVEDGLNNENVEHDKFTDDSSTKDVNVARKHINIVSPDVNTGSLKLNVVDPSVNTTSSNEHDSPKDMFTIGVSSTLEATHIELFNDEDEPEVDLGNITNSYTVPTTPNIRIHKDHPIDNVIGDVKSSVQTKRMTKPTSKQGFLNDVYNNPKFSPM
ncbi:putative ribonuclease H-like domain-containing protein [Tanacetum coccineum]